MKIEDLINKNSLDILNNPKKYKQAPYDHIVIDNFFNEEYINELVKYSKKLKLKDSSKVKLPPNKDTQYKYAYDNIDEFPKVIRKIFKSLVSAEFCKKLEEFTGIKNFISNNEKLKGGGFHKITNKGFLNLHTDFNNYQDNLFGSLDRRINLLVYLNPNWKEEYGGHLWICDKNKKTVCKKILPIMNRCVIFSTTNKSIHGHPERLNVPNNDIHRDSIAIYYYTKNKNKEKCFEGDKFHSTIYYNKNKFK